VSARQRALRERREALLRQSAAQRAALVADVHDLVGSVSLADRGVALLRQLGARRVVLAVGAVAMVAFGPARVIGWAWRGYLTFNTVRSVIGR
jgi:hypothetical protein